MFSEQLTHLLQAHLTPICLGFVLCIGVGTAIGLLMFYYAEPYSLVVDVRRRAAWIAAATGSVICCGIVMVSGLESDPLTFAGFLLFGAVTSSGSGLIPLTLGLPALRRSSGNYKAERQRSSHRGKERLKD